MNGLNFTFQIENNVFQLMLFLIYINDLNLALKLCKVHHLADNTNLLHFSKWFFTLNKYVNLDLKNLTHWLNVNKI